jgi:hypothetical protein
VIYVKATIAGLVSAVLLGIVAIIIEGFLTFQSASSGSAGIGAVSVGTEAFVPAAVVGFLLGFFFVVRRARHRPFAR